MWPITKLTSPLDEWAPNVSLKLVLDSRPESVTVTPVREVLRYTVRWVAQRTGRLRSAQCHSKTSSS